MKTVTKRTGQALTLTSSQAALDVLQRWVAQSDLDIPATAALMQSASTEMEAHPTLTMSDLMRILTPIFSHFTKAGHNHQVLAQLQCEVLNACQNDVTWFSLPYGTKGTIIQAKLRG